MPFYHDYSDENAVILYWKYGEEDNFNVEELIEPENLERAKDFHPKKTFRTSYDSSNAKNDAS